jgi:FkbM family methyltransferase
VHKSICLIRHILRHESNRGQRFRRLLAAAAWQIWKRSIAQPIVVDLFNGYRFLAYPDCDSSLNAIYFHVPDYREVTFLRKRIQGGVLIDVGANVGLFTLSVADKVDRAFLFEPNATASQRAKSNMVRNHLDFEVHTVALSDEVGELFLEDRGGVDSTNRTLIDPQTTSFPTRKVRRITLDSFIKEHVDVGKNIALVKIDVEGHENAVLRGMQKTLVTLRPQILMFEYLQRTSFSETQELLNTAGYTIYSLNRQGDLTPVVGNPQPLQNLFALPTQELA